MSMLSSLLSLVSGKRNVSQVVQVVQSAMQSGRSPDAAMGNQLATLLRGVLPRNAGNMIEALDQLVPDSLEAKFGLTPQMKQFIKSALQQHAQSAPVRR